MARQIINTGTAPNDGTGDSLRVAGVKINDNFNELYTHKSTLSTVAVSGSYTDLINQPTIASDVSDLTDTTNLLFVEITRDISVDQTTTHSLGSSGNHLLNVYAANFIGDGSSVNLESDSVVTINAGQSITLNAPTITIPGYISVTDLQTVVAASTDFADFQVRVAAL